jgi:hypothetical protein
MNEKETYELKMMNILFWLCVVNEKLAQHLQQRIYVKIMTYLK